MPKLRSLEGIGDNGQDRLVIYTRANKGFLLYIFPLFICACFPNFLPQTKEYRMIGKHSPFSNLGSTRHDEIGAADALGSSTGGASELSERARNESSKDAGSSAG